MNYIKSAKIACLFLLLSFLFSGCAAPANVQPVTTETNELTHGNVKLKLEVGVTTQAEVLEGFGAPNITTIDSQGREVWSYQRAASVQQSSSTNKGIYLSLIHI